jgi:hypothetical protein
MWHCNAGMILAARGCAKTKETARTGRSLRSGSRAQRSEAEDMADRADEVAEPAHTVAAAVAFAAAGAVTVGATDNDGKLFVVEKFVVHGRLTKAAGAWQRKQTFPASC